MNRWISAVDRIIVLIVGIALLAAGAYAIAWDAGASLIRTWVSRLDREVLFGLPEEPWWHWVLSGTFVLCVFAGFGLLYLNLRRAPYERSHIAAQRIRYRRQRGSRTRR